ncbi:hypothetical protein [Helicobacter sp. T3_23-1056]
MSKNMQNLKTPKGQNLQDNATKWQTKSKIEQNLSKKCQSSQKWQNPQIEQNPQKSQTEQTEQNPQKWYEKNECAGSFWLKVTLVLVSAFYHPILRPILNLCIAFVTAVYFVFSPNERRNIARFYENLEGFIASQNPQKMRLKPKSWLQRQCQIYGNFYEFGSAICDKIASWLGKISHKDIEIINIDFIKNELMPPNNAESKKGQILVVSHFGNIEVCRALRNEMGEMGKIPLSILMYEKIAKDFIALLHSISKDKESLNPKSHQSIILVDNLDMDSLLQIKDLLDSGVNIGIMGDRVAIDSTSRGKNAKFDFLGKPCYFPQGAFLLAGVLNVKISMLWCEKQNGKYQIELENISQTPVRFARDKSSRTKDAQVRGLAQKYVESLQKRVVANPKSWFNFYDFWAV